MSSPELRAAPSAKEIADTRRSVRRRLAMALPLPIIGALVYFQAKRADPGLRVVAEGAALESDGRVRAAERPATLRYSDGSTVELSPGTAARVVATAPLGSRVELLEGRLVAKVVSPTPMARWFFEGSKLEVVTPGATLEVARRALQAPRAGHELVVVLRDGQANLRGAALAGTVPLRPGERMIFADDVGVPVRRLTGGAPETRAAAVALDTAGPETPALELAEGSAFALTARARHRLDGKTATGVDVASGFPSSPGTTLDEARFPEDPRLQKAPSFSWTLAHAFGRRLLFDTGTPGKIRVFRFDGAGGAVAVAALELGFGPAPGLPRDHAAARSPAWVWRDDDGDGARHVGEYAPYREPFSWSAAIAPDGTVWRSAGRDGVDRYACEGVDARGVPVYRFTAASPGSRLPMPAELSQIERIVLGEKGAVYLAGYTGERPSPYKEQATGAIGTELLRYDDFAGAPKLRWRRPLLVDATAVRRAVGVTAAGPRVFVMYAHDPSVHVFEAETGAPASRLLLADENSPFDPSSSPQPVRAFVLPGGGAWLFVADAQRGRALSARLD